MERAVRGCKLWAVLGGGGGGVSIESFKGRQ